jgi:hypothetical protein
MNLNRCWLPLWAAAIVASAAFATPARADCVRSPHSRYLTALRVTIATGGDDLRGGSDNVDLAVDVSPDGRTPSWVTLTGRGGLNGFRRWPDWSVNTVTIPVVDAAGCPVAVGLIRRVRLFTSFGGGLSGDNWNMRSIHIDWLTDSLLTGVLLDVPRPGHTRDSYVFRFTGDHRVWEHDAAPPRLVEAPG